MDDKLTISPSGLRLFNECGQAYKYAYIDKLQRKGVKKKFFDIGTYYHELQHVYNQLLKLGHTPGSDFLVDAIRSRIETDSEDMTTDNIEVYAKCWPLISKFVTYQSPRIDAGIKPLGIEYEFHVDIGPVVLHGIIDLFYEDASGKIILRDHKTSSNKNAWTQEKLMMDGQQIFYLLALSELYGTDVLVSEINFACTYDYKTKVPLLEDTFKSFRYTHNKETLEAFKDNLLRTVNLILEGEPRRVYNDRCGNCQFFQICHLESRGLPILNVINSNYESRKPRDPSPADNSFSIKDSYTNTQRRHPTDFKLHLDFSGWESIRNTS